MVTVQAAGPEVARELTTPKDVEELVSEYGSCVVAGAPGSGLSVAFDRETGFVGGSEAAAPSSDLLDRAEDSMTRCDTALAYQASIDLYVLRAPEAMAISQSGGLEPAAGQRLVFGNRALFD